MFTQLSKFVVLWTKYQRLTSCLSLLAAMSPEPQIGINAKRVITGSEVDEMNEQQILEAVKHVNVFARVKPEHKLVLVQGLQQIDHVVAVTGDGVNDAPALKAADVGIAMGQRGSDVSREVADLVLLDDNFSTIISAIEEGRSIYENIKKFIRILFSTNLAEVLLVAFGTLLTISIGLRHPNGDLMLPLLAVQILWINLLTDSLPALTVALDKNPRLMQERPSPTNSPLVDRSGIIFTAIVGGFIGLVALALLYWLPIRGFDLVSAQTMVFTYLTISQLSVIIPARKIGTLPSLNVFVWLAILTCCSLQLLAVYLPALNTLLQISTIDSRSLLLLGMLAASSWLLAEITSMFLRRTKQVPHPNNIKIY
jgi:Ca2+-transporting ATPase